MPHRDFDDPYTGGLAFFHAAVFRVFGMNLAATRAVFFVISLLFVATLHSILRRELTPLTAGLTTLMGVVWSLPNYFSAVPSWYILYLSTFGLWSLLKYLDTGRRRWLVAAGCCGGLGVLMKIVGLFYLAAALLFFIYHEQSQAKTESARDDRRSPTYFLFTVLVAMTPALLLALLTRKVGGAMTMIQFVVPMLLLALTLIWNEWTCGRGRFWVRVQRLLRTVAPFVIGVLLPIVPFLAPYVASGALGDLYHGLFVLPQKRFEFGVFPLPDLIYLACPAAVLAVSEFCRRLHNRRLNAACIAVAAGSLCLRSGRVLLSLLVGLVAVQLAAFHWRCVLDSHPQHPRRSLEPAPPPTPVYGVSRGGSRLCFAIPVLRADLLLLHGAAVDRGDSIRV